MTPAPALSQEIATANGYLLVLSIVVPMAGVLLAFAAGGRNVQRVAFATFPLGLAIAVAIALAKRGTDAPLVYLLGGWTPPLGLALRADGLSAVMMVATAVVVCGIAVFAHSDFRIPSGVDETRKPFTFWILLLAIWGALNTIFVAGDLFTLYVALELLTFAAVPLVCLDGRTETLQAALRYLLFALVGSVLYLVGTALLYGAYGTLDIGLLAKRVDQQPAAVVAAALMTVGLLAKTAVFPLHLWLPPAHAGAPAAASAVLSALVVKGSYFLLVRLWFDVMPDLPGASGTQLLGALGAAAILVGSVVALRQERLKLLIAYSTLAQIGYLFLMFPLAISIGATQLEAGTALSGGLLQAISHATAKAAMFMSAGLIYAALGHDRLAGLAGIGRAMPLTVLAFAFGGIALIGVPPSGAALAKELLLRAAADTGQWGWDIVIQAGGVLTCSYVVLVLAYALAPVQQPVVLRAPVPRWQQAAVLALALCSLLIGLVPWDAYLFVPPEIVADMFSIKAFSKLLWSIMAGGALALLLGIATPPAISFAALNPMRKFAAPFGHIFERLDGVLRQWPAAGLALLGLGLLFIAALHAPR